MSGNNFDELESLEARHIEKDYVCSKCWGRLITQKIKGVRLFKVTCPKCGDDQGFVTRDYAETRRNENKLEAIEVEHKLGKMLGLKKEPIDREKLIKQMWK